VNELYRACEEAATLLSRPITEGVAAAERAMNVILSPFQSEGAAPMLLRLAVLLDRSINRTGLGGRNRRRTPWLEGLEERCLLSGISAITEFPLPSGSLIDIGPDSVTAGPDGNI
jgi:hypothetical protein